MYFTPAPLLCQQIIVVNTETAEIWYVIFVVIIVVILVLNMTHSWRQEYVVPRHNMFATSN